ncbi:MAG: hypothetical protein IJ863_04690 [Spirochaetales bacterium]|nr:hypothetical protein [Spirochaetales bacterium]
MIKVSSFSSDINRATLLSERNRVLFEEMERNLGQRLVPAPIEDYDADLKLIFISSGGSEGKFLKAFGSLKAPYYLLTSGTDNSLAASLEILTYLNDNRLPGEILHGSPQYIAGRIRALIEGKTAETGHRSCSHIGKATIGLGGRYGVIGHPSDWLIASTPDRAKVKDIFGSELIDISMDELLEAYRCTGKKEETSGNLDFGSSKRLVEAVGELKDRYGLDGLTIRCFDLLDSIHTTGCLSLATLNAQGIIGSCEGDIMSMLTMAVVRKVTGQSSFQANPSRIDPDANRMVIAHCTLPLDMPESYSFDTHFESGIGVAIKGELKEGPVTVLRISRDLRTFWCAEGTIIRNLNERTLCRTQIEIQFDDCDHVGDLLKWPCGNHHIVFYGRQRRQIEEFLGVKV